MTETFLVGQLVPLTFLVEDPDEELVAPGAYTLVIERPDGSEDDQTVNVTSPGAGVFYCDYPGGLTGRHVARFTTTGSSAGVVEDTFFIVALGTAYGDLTALKQYLGNSASQWSDEDLKAVLDTESEDQIARVGERSPLPIALHEALMRRCARNLAMRAFPLGIVTQADFEATRLGQYDPEIRRLEAPYRKRVIG